MNNNSKIIAVVPIKLNSERVESKNLREFYDGKSLTETLIDNLKSSKMVSKIYISTNAVNYREYFESLGCHFIERDDKYCNNITPWSDVIHNVVQSIPEDNDRHLAWCHTTCPLFENYDGAIKTYFDKIETNEINGLITVTKSSEFIITDKKQPLNYTWGPWHRYSQHLEKIYNITGALFIAKKSEFLKNRYVISSNPELFEVSAMESLDIDTEYDFELAKILIKNKNHLKKYD